MSAWSELEFEYESRSVVDPACPGYAGRLKVYISTYATGSYEEPQLEPDGDPWIELLDDKGCPLREVSLEELSAEERQEVLNRIDKEIDAALEAHSCDIGQHVAEIQADALYESWKDRDE